MLSPIDLLQARVMSAPQGDATASTLPSPAPADALPPAPVSGPSTGGGGFGGIGSALARAFSGEGIIGDTSGDAEIDPMTGMPRGLQRRATNQSIMKMGMMLMAAGMRQSDDSRAKMLSTLPAVMDTSDQVNNFAKNRLEMAKVKLAERQQLQEMASSAAIDRNLGFTPAGPSPGVPVGSAPATVVPPAGMGAGTASGSPATAAAPVNGPTPAASASTAPASPTLPLTSPPPAPVRPQFQPSQQQAQALALMAPGDKIKAYNAMMQEYNKTEYTGAPYVDPTIGQQVVDVYVGGQKVGRRAIGSVPTVVKDTTDDEGTTTREKVDPVSGAVRERTEVRDPATEEARKAATETIKADRNELQKNYTTNVRPAIETYDRIDKLQKIVSEGKSISGPLAERRVSWLNSLAAMGFLNKDAIKDLINTSDVQAELGRAGGEFAKKYYGPQISNMDVTTANKVMGALLSNDKDVQANALERIKNLHRETINAYKQDAELHNSRIPEHLGEKYSKIFKAPTIDRDFSPQLPAESAPAPAAGQARKQIIPGKGTFVFQDGKWHKVIE
jgi:hypothetical protein